MRDMSVDLSNSRFNELKELDRRVRAISKAVIPQVTSNGEILAGLIGNASDMEME